MDSTEAGIIERYGKALQFYLTYIPSDDASWDRRIWDALKEADAEIREHGLEGKREIRTSRVARRQERPRDTRKTSIGSS